MTEAFRRRTALRPDFGGIIMRMKDAAEPIMTRTQRFQATLQPRPTFLKTPGRFPSIQE